MADREKVVKGLECCSKGDCADCDNCTYHGIQTDVPCESTLMRDALALLKTQEPVKPYAEYSEHTGTKWLTCGACNQPMIKMTPDAVYPNYCPECGRKVMLE